MQPAALPSLQPRGCTNLKLRQLTRRVTQHYDAEMGAIGLKTTQYSLLSHVDKLGPLRPGELAAHMKMDPSTLTRNLKPLVAAGWVVLGQGTDARSRMVSITDEGRAMRASAQRHWRLAQTRLNEKLGSDRVAALHAMVDELMLRLEAPAQQDESDEDIPNA
jgi:DNA-binding MarR family transcriptional regulator